MDLVNLNKVLTIIQCRKFNDARSLGEVQSLLKLLSSAVSEIELNLKNVSERSRKNRLKLCLLQIVKVLENMSNLVGNSAATTNFIVLEVLMKKITWNLNEVTNIFCNTLKNTEDDNFVSLMDSLIVDFKSKKKIELNNKVDNLLCHALTIANLSTREDFKEISTSCKNVLAACSSLECDRVSTNFDLDGEYILSHLEILGRKINTSLLRLFLHIMASPWDPLKNMVRMCQSGENKLRLEDDLDDLIAEFDLTSERIHLIGSFALTSCDDENMRLKVQNCLADLEFVEESLVPSISNFYMDSSNVSKRELSKYLCDEWKSTAFKLNEHLEHIIEPGALFQVATEDLSDLLDNIRRNFSVGSKLSIDSFLKRSKKVYNTLKNTPEECLTRDNNSITDLMQSLKREFSIVDNMRERPNNDVISNLEDILSIINSISQQIVNFLNSSLNALDISNITTAEYSSNDISSTSVHTPERKVANILLDHNSSKSPFVTPVRKTVTLKKHLEKALGMTPFTPTLYVKTPNVKRKQKAAFHFEDSETFC